MCMLKWFCVSRFLGNSNGLVAFWHSVQKICSHMMPLQFKPSYWAVRDVCCYNCIVVSVFSVLVEYRRFRWTHCPSSSSEYKRLAHNSVEQRHSLDIFSRFVEPEGPLRFSRAKRPIVRILSHIRHLYGPTQSIWFRPVLISFSHLRLDLTIRLFPSSFPTKTLYFYLSRLPCVSRFSSVIFFSIWSPG